MNKKQTRRNFLKTTALSLMTLGISCKLKSKKPNIVIIFLDDSGWSDFRPFDTPKYSTPNVNRLAHEGCSYHNFYVPQAVCSASRASLLTGCYPGRTKIFGAHVPKEKGLSPQFATFGEIFKKNGYRTAIFGKWHVGDQPETRPYARGFDESCGLMYSNDMWEYHPVNPEYWGKYPLQYWDNNQIAIERVTPKEQAMLTTWYTERAVNFIHRHKDVPFLLYIPHSMPHVPLYCSHKFKNKSGAGLYGDVIMEIDWSVGEILKELKNNKLDDNTIVIFTSDNGPWISYGNHAGKTPFREAKRTIFDGGTRSPCIIKYPGHIKPKSTSTNAFCSIDILPTLCYLSKTSLPGNEIDGKNVWDLISQKPDAKNPHIYYAFSTGNHFEGVMTRDGRWKLHLPHQYPTLKKPGINGNPGKYIKKNIELSLFDMTNDPYEQTNVIDKYPQIADKLKQFAQIHEQKFYSNESHEN
jgi:arylsulfatase A-like enzyme